MKKTTKAPDGDLATNDLELSDVGPDEKRMSPFSLFLILASVFVAAAVRNRLRAAGRKYLLVFPGEQRRAILPDDWLLSFRDGPGIVGVASHSRQIDPAAGGVGNLAGVVRWFDSSRSVPRLCLHRRLPVPDARHHPDHRHANRAGNPPPDTDPEKTRIVTDDPVECAFGRLRWRSGRGCSLPVFLFAGSRSVSYITRRRRPQPSCRFGHSCGSVGSAIGQGPGRTLASGRPGFPVYWSCSQFKPSP